MTMTTDSDKREQSVSPDAPHQSVRHVYGPRPVAALVPAIVRPAFRRRAPATAQVLADWEAIVGPAVAAVTTPRRLSAGTLTIACSGPVAMELQHLSAALINRINAHLGEIAVRQLRFVQNAVPTPVSLPLPPPGPDIAAAAKRAVADLPEGGLRDALEALGRAVLADNPGRPA
jgi:hypothetical protein